VVLSPCLGYWCKLHGVVTSWRGSSLLPPSVLLLSWVLLLRLLAQQAATPTHTARYVRQIRNALPHLDRAQRPPPFHRGARDPWLLPFDWLSVYLSLRVTFLRACLRSCRSVRDKRVLGIANVSGLFRRNAPSRNPFPERGRPPPEGREPQRGRPAREERQSKPCGL